MNKKYLTNEKNIPISLQLDYYGLFKTINNAYFSLTKSNYLYDWDFNVIYTKSSFRNRVGDYSYTNFGHFIYFMYYKILLQNIFILSLNHNHYDDNDKFKPMYMIIKNYNIEKYYTDQIMPKFFDHILISESVFAMSKNPLLRSFLYLNKKNKNNKIIKIDDFEIYNCYHYIFNHYNIEKINIDVDFYNNKKTFSFKFEFCNVKYIIHSLKHDFFVKKCIFNPLIYLKNKYIKFNKRNLFNAVSNLAYFYDQIKYTPSNSLNSTHNLNSYLKTFLSKR